MRAQDISVDEFEPFGDEPSRLGRVRRALSTAIGAVVALALLMGVGVWFYRLGVRDAENVPIIRAAAEPAKTRPEDPGGAVAPHQNITSYSVAGSKPAQATAAVIAPPPPEPKREDVAMGALAPEAAERPVVRATPVAPSPDAQPAAVRASGPPPTFTATAQQSEEAAKISGASALDPEETVLALGEVSESASAALVGPEDDPAALSGPPVDPVPDASGFAPPLSPVAPRRPTDLRERMAAAVQQAERSASDLTRRAAESQVQVQLAADPSEDVIRTMWRRISNANSDLLHDRELAVQTTVSGGTTFYRLRVGPFGGVSEARAVCQALKARGQDCIVARNG